MAVCGEDTRDRLKMLTSPLTFDVDDSSNDYFYDDEFAVPFDARLCDELTSSQLAEAQTDSDGKPGFGSSTLSLSAGPLFTPETSITDAATANHDAEHVTEADDDRSLEYTTNKQHYMLAAMGASSEKTTWAATRKRPLTPHSARRSTALSSSGDDGQQSMTSWRAMASPSSSEGELRNLASVESRDVTSSNEVRQNQLRNMHLDLSASSESSAAAEKESRRRSSPLLDLFMRTKSQSGDSSALLREEEVVVRTLHAPIRLDSPSLSDSSGHVASGATRDCDSRLKHWNTKKNLNESDSSDYTAIQNIHLNNLHSPISLSPRRRPSPQQDSASQHPPPSNTVSIQTSFNSSFGENQLSERYTSIDIGVQTPRRSGSDPLFGRSGLPVSQVSPMVARTRLSRQLQREGNKALPDLSFLRERSLSASCILRATTPADKKPAKRKTDAIRSHSDTPPPVPPRLRRRVIDVTPASRESSPALCVGRKLGSSRGVTSFGSSSSSGIDAGRSFDSQLNRLSEALDLSLLPGPIAGKCSHFPSPSAVVMQCARCERQESTSTESARKSNVAPASATARKRKTAHENETAGVLRRAATSDSDQLTLSRWPNEPVRLRRPLKSCLRQKGGSADSTPKRSSW